MVKRVLSRLLGPFQGGETDTGDVADAPDEASVAEMETAPTPGSKRREFMSLLEANGGRMKQADLVSETAWSSATVSRELSAMEDDGLISKISVGRENVVSVKGAEPDWYRPPHPAVADGASPESSQADTESAVLLVEDKPSHARLFTEAFQEANVSAAIHVVQDGSDAVRFLRQEGQYHDAPRPVLMLLDLSLKMVDGLDVLRELNESASATGIPVIVLSESDAPSDMRAAYAEGAVGYIVKPATFDERVKLAAAIDDFWLTHISHPPIDRLQTP